MGIIDFKNRVPATAACCLIIRKNAENATMHAAKMTAFAIATLNIDCIKTSSITT